MSHGVQPGKPSIVLVGGFLGSGKTSLILAVSRRLEQRGLRCAVVLNDQGDELVDTRFARTTAMHTREVTGGCFCCRYSGLHSVIDELRESDPDIIFAEPVGSCTDISATVIGPLLEDFDRYRVAPFTVLVDPARAAELMSRDADADLAFLFQKQLQEADLVCMSKADLYPNAEGIAGHKVRHLSSRTGRGVQEWIDEILFGQLEAGSTRLEIDYTAYARAEAALAWLDLSFIFEPTTPISPASAIGPFLDGLDEAITKAGLSIVHLKIFDNSATGWLKAAICSNGQEPTVEGNLEASPAPRHELLLNLRAKASPLLVRQIVEEQLHQLDGRTFDQRIDCFSPAPPKPERRGVRA